MKFVFQVINGQINFGTPARAARIQEMLKANEKQYFYITRDDRESDHMRRFFEGAVVPYYFYQNPNSGWENFEEAREALKLEHNFRYVNDKEGKRQKISRSTMMPKYLFVEFLGKVQRDFEENGFEYPDAEAYKSWEDTAPAPGEEYDPLKKLKAKYELEKK